MSLAEQERLMLSRFLDGECPPRESAEASALLDRNPEARDYVASLVRIEDALLPIPRSEPVPRRKLPWVAAAAVLIAAIGLAALLFSGSDEIGEEVPATPSANAIEAPVPAVAIEAVGAVAQVAGPAGIIRGEERLPTAPGSKIAPGDRLVVPDRAFLELELKGGLLLTLAPGTECRVSRAPRQIALLDGAIFFTLQEAEEEWEFTVPATGARHRASTDACGYLLFSDPLEAPGSSLTFHLARGELTAADESEDAALSAPSSRRVRYRTPGERIRTVTLEWGAGGLGGRIDERLFLVEIREPNEDAVERYQLLTWPRLPSDTRLALADLIEQGRLLRELPPLDRGLLAGMRGKGLLDDPLTVASRAERVDRFRRNPRPRRPVRTVDVDRVRLDEKSLAALVGAPVAIPQQFRGKVFVLNEKKTIAPEALLIAISKWLRLSFRIGPDGYSLAPR